MREARNSASPGHLAGTLGSTHAYQQFGTIPPETREFEQAVTPILDIPTPLPTVGPGSSFDEKPAVKFTEEGDDRFGYGPLEGSDELCAVWTTDETGTHYVIVHKDSELLRATEDTVTGGRHENGIEQLIKQREDIKQLLDQELGQAGSRLASSNRSFSLGMGLAVGAAAACVFITLGVCGIIAGIAGGFLFAAYNGQDSSLAHLASATNYSEAISSLDGRLNERLEKRTQGELEAAPRAAAGAR